MSKDALKAKRAGLEQLLARYESGNTTHYDEDARGELTRDTSPERIASIRSQIADIDRQLSEDWRFDA